MSYLSQHLDLDRSICTLGGSPWTYRDSFEGVAIFGGLGSAKSRGSGRAIARAFVRAGYGGLVLTCKQDEADVWQGYMAEAGRLHDFVRVNTESAHRFNWLEYEAKRATRGGGSTTNIAASFTDALQDRVLRSNDAYWDMALGELLKNAIDAELLATGTLSLEGLNSTVLTAVTSRKQRFQGVRVVELLRTAFQRNDLTQLERARLDLAFKYFTKSYPNLDSKPRSIVVSCFTGRVTDLLRDKLRPLFAEPGEPTFAPDLSTDGKVICLDVPIHAFGEVGRFAQRLYKTVWQRAVQHQDKSKELRPLFLWADEAHFFRGGDGDLQFASTCRDYRTSVVVISQNLPNYYSTSGAHDPESSTKAYLGCLRTKVFHGNPDDVTNEWAERLFGTREQMIEGYSVSDSAPIPGFADYLEHPATGGNRSWNQQDRPNVPRSAFFNLNCGEAFIFYRNGQALFERFRID